MEASSLAYDPLETFYYNLIHFFSKFSDSFEIFDTDMSPIFSLFPTYIYFNSSYIYFNFQYYYEYIN